MPNSPINLDENIIALLGVQDLPEAERREMIDRMSELVEKRVMLRLLESLSEEDTTQAEELADQPEKLLAFLSRKADLGQLISEETDKLRNELVIGLAENQTAEEKSPDDAK